MRAAAAYVRQRRRVLLGFLICAALFAVVFRLYGLPLGAVAYPALLCLVLGLGVLLWDLRRSRLRHRAWVRAASLPGALMTDLPPARTPEQEDALAVIQALRRELAQQESAAEDRFRDMVDYYTVWAHQIKTPISSMRLTLRREDSPAGRALASDLLRIEQYVDMVLAFLRLDGDGSDYLLRTCCLDDILRAAVRRFAGEFIGRNIRLDFRPTGERPVTDEKWLGFVAEQVLSNALKYTPPGGCVSIAMEAPHVLVISDTGVGIAPEDLPRIFEKGYTGANGRADLRATGLGLYLCRRVCGRLGVGISADSIPGEGTAVRLDLSQYPLRAE